MLCRKWNYENRNELIIHEVIINIFAFSLLLSKIIKLVMFFTQTSVIMLAGKFAAIYLFTLLTHFQKLVLFLLFSLRLLLIRQSLNSYWQLKLRIFILMHLHKAFLLNYTSVHYNYRGLRVKISFQVQTEVLEYHCHVFFLPISSSFMTYKNDF